MRTRRPRRGALHLRLARPVVWLAAIAAMLTIAACGDGSSGAQADPSRSVHRIGSGVDPNDGLTGWARATARIAAACER